MSAFNYDMKDSLSGEPALESSFWVARAVMHTEAKAAIVLDAKQK